MAVSLIPATVRASDKPQKFIAGYAPFTTGTIESYWQVCDECSALGFRYVETSNTRLQIVQAYSGRISEFKEEMEKRKLSLAGLGMTGSFTGKAAQAATRDEHLLVARFVQAAGGNYISTMTEPQPSEVDEYAKFANELGRLLREETGVRLGFHPHAGSARSQVYRGMLDQTDPENFGFILDTGWIRAGGEDPLAALNTYRSRVITLHLKDFDPNAEVGREGRRGRGRPVALGRGVIDFHAIVNRLKETEFDGQVLGELGLEGAEEMRDYMVDKLGLRL
jgi:sugar phosphate isomerase/epimerase